MSQIETTIESENFSAGYLEGLSEGRVEAVKECLSLIESRRYSWGDKCDTAKEECKVLLYAIKEHFKVE